MRHVPLECDINIAVNGCSGFATSTQKGPFTVMLISHSGGTYLIRIPPFAWQRSLLSAPSNSKPKGRLAGQLRLLLALGLGLGVDACVGGYVCVEGYVRPEIS